MRRTCREGSLKLEAATKECQKLKGQYERAKQMMAESLAMFKEPQEKGNKNLRKMLDEKSKEIMRLKLQLVQKGPE